MQAVLRRLKVLGVGLVLGALLALATAGPATPPWYPLSERVKVWAWFMGGPILGTSWGMLEFHLLIGLGWLGLPLIPAHPIRPSMATAWLTAAGLTLWFLSGF